MLFSDIVFYTGWGLVNPLFALFIVGNIKGGSPFAVGVATAIYWATFSILRIPFGIFLDNKIGERDDYCFMVFGLFLASMVPFGYIFSTEIWHIYILQFLHGLGTSISVAGWSAIFCRHIDKTMESTEYGLSGSSVALTTSVSAVIGGWAIEKLGFKPVFACVGLLGLVGVLLLFAIEGEFKGHFDPSQYLKRLTDANFWNKFFEKSALIKSAKDSDVR